MKKIIAFITVIFLISSIFGTAYAEDAVEEIGIIEGVVFNGDDEVTRNDVGIMILNVLNVLKWIPN